MLPAAATTAAALEVTITALEAATSKAAETTTKATGARETTTKVTGARETKIAVDVEVLIEITRIVPATTPGTIHLGHLFFVQLKNCVHTFHLLICFYYLYSLELYPLFCAPFLASISMGRDGHAPYWLMCANV
jgi:hypothetical protein